MMFIIDCAMLAGVCAVCGRHAVPQPLIFVRARG
jgi:hypothetical protein